MQQFMFSAVLLSCLSPLTLNSRYSSPVYRFSFVRGVRISGCSLVLICLSNLCLIPYVFASFLLYPFHPSDPSDIFYFRCLEPLSTTLCLVRPSFPLPISALGNTLICKLRTLFS